MVKWVKIADPESPILYYSEGLRPIREGIENLPKAMLPKEEKEEDALVGVIASHYLN